jgi:hypothetical protein
MGFTKLNIFRTGIIPSTTEVFIFYRLYIDTVVHTTPQSNCTPLSIHRIISMREEEKEERERRRKLKQRKSEKVKKVSSVPLITLST